MAFLRARRGPDIEVPPDQKLKVGIIGGGLAGMITAMDLSEAGHDVEIFEARPFMGGKASARKYGDWLVPIARLGSALVGSLVIPSAGQRTENRFSLHGISKFPPPSHRLTLFPFLFPFLFFLFYRIYLLIIRS